MKRGGLLDGFPVHLFAGGDGNHPVLIIDNADLGRLQLVPHSESLASVIVATDDELDGNLESGNRRIVFENINDIPLPDESMGMIVMMSSNSREKAAGFTRGRLLPEALSEFVRLLKPKGRLIILTHMSDQVAGLKSDHPGVWASSETYYVRPASGNYYFVTKDWSPSAWPFDSAHGGVLRQVRLHAGLIASRIGLKPLYDSVCIRVLSKTDERSLVEESACESEGGWRDTPEARSTFGVVVKPGWNAVMFGNDEPGVVVKFPLHPDASQKMERQIRNIEALQGKPALEALVPRMLRKGIRSDQAYWAETRLEGLNGMTLRLNPRWKRKVTESAYGFLLNLHLQTKQPTLMNVGVFEDLVRPSVLIIENAVSAKHDISDGLAALVEGLWKVFRGRKVPLVRTHGDFWPGNILVSSEGNLTGVLDWDASLEHGWPLTDLIHMIAYQRKWQARWFFGRLVTGRLLHQRFAGWERDMVEGYCKSLGIEDGLWPSFIALYWLTYISQWTDVFSESRLVGSVVKPLDDIIKSVSNI